MSASRSSNLVLPTRKTRWVGAKCHRVTSIKPSYGQPQERVICQTRMKIGTLESEIDSINTELKSYNARRELLPARRDRAQRHASD